MRVKRRTHKLRRLLARVLTAALVAGPVALVALWLTFQHKPGWYRPVILDEAGIQRARSEAVRAADYVSDQMVEGRPFAAVLHDRSVNAWLAALPHSWPEARDVLPPQISDPAVRFDSGELRVGAHYAAEGWQAIISIGVKLGVSEDSGAVEIALNGAHGGSLPVPRVVLEGILDHLLQTLHARHDRSIEAAEPLVSALREVQSVDELYEGVRIRNRFVWFNGDRPFRIDSIIIDDGELRLQIEPL
ncbi:MAG: hypothetical protein WBE26_00875 [Phycisphaerae bacterium]